MLETVHYLNMEEMDHSTMKKTKLESRNTFNIGLTTERTIDHFFMKSDVKLEDDPFQLFELVEGYTKNKKFKLLEAGRNDQSYK